MSKKILKVIAFFVMSLFVLLGNNIALAGAGQSSAETAAQGGGGSFSGEGGFSGASGDGSCGVR